MWNPQYYQWLLDFLEKQENTKIFFWVDQEQLMINFNPPNNLSGKIWISALPFKIIKFLINKIIELGINLAELQICYFLKKRYDIPITP